MTIELHPLAPNFTQVHVNELSIWFSYRTPVAYQVHGGGRCVRVNDWSTTTGKHLNQIDGGSKAAKEARLEGSSFEAALASVIQAAPRGVRASTYDEKVQRALRFALYP